MFQILSTLNCGRYVYCHTNPIHPKATPKGVYLMHRVVVENKLGRLLDTSEEVHHINEDKTDNRVENLEVLSKSEHARRHAKQVKSIEVKCAKCDKVFQVMPHEFRLRLKRNKIKKLFCSISCSRFYLSNK